jgi:hypothetical protein
MKANFPGRSFVAAKEDLAMFRNSITGAAVLTLTGSLLAAAPASAHHSYAQFDASQTISMAATVVTWEWTNPHSQLQVEDNATGDKWYLECASPSMLSRTGMTRTTFKPGDKVTVKMHPRRDKTLNGSLLSVDLDGKVLLFQAAGGPPGVPGGRSGGPPGVPDAQ